jgi:hypothetical protein
MNAVQTHLEDFTSWDRFEDGTFAAFGHLDAKTCQVARICPRYSEFRHTVYQVKSQTDYVKDELLPAIDQLVAQEENRWDRSAALAKATAGFRPMQESEQQTLSNKRKQEQDDSERAAKKRKEDNDKICQVMMQELHAVRKRVDEKMTATKIEIDGDFDKFKDKILQLMVTEV